MPNYDELYRVIKAKAAKNPVIALANGIHYGCADCDVVTEYPFILEDKNYHREDCTWRLAYEMIH